MLVKILLLLLFFGCMIAVGLYARKSANSMTDFVLGGRSVGPWLSAFAYGTSYFSAVVFVGYAGQFGWKYGLASTWIGLGNAVIGSLLAWVAMGRRTRVMTHHLEVATMPDFFGRRYDSNVIKIVASAIAFVFMIPYTASVYNGLSRLFGMAFDIPYTVCVITMAVLTGVYVILGGYMATAINDFIQGIIMLFGIVAVIGAVLSGQGGFIEAVRKLSELPSDVPVTMGQQGAFASFFGTDPLNLLGVIILVLSASMSTLSSLVLTSASTLTLDFIKGNIIKEMDDRKQLIYIRVLIVFFIVISVVLALNPPTFIAQLMGISWGALAGAFLAPFLYGLYWKGVTRAGVWASFVCGVGITVSNMFFKFIASPINAGAVAMIAGLIITPVVSLMTPKINAAFVNEIFQCYDNTAKVSSKEYLKEEP